MDPETTNPDLPVADPMTPVADPMATPVPEEVPAEEGEAAV